MSGTFFGTLFVVSIIIVLIIIVFKHQPKTTNEQKVILKEKQPKTKTKKYKKVTI